MTDNLTKKAFNQCVDIAKEMVRPHLKAYDDSLTQQEWEVVMILFKHILKKNE